MDVGAALVASAESLEGVQPGEAALDHPALLAQPGAVRDAAAGDPRRDAALAQLAAVDVVVVAAIGEQLPRAAARPATSPADRRHGVDQRNQLCDVVAIAPGEADRQRDSAGLDHQVVLGARPSAIDWRGADVVPPPAGGRASGGPRSGPGPARRRRATRPAAARAAPASRRPRSSRSAAASRSPPSSRPGTWAAGSR